MLMGFGRVKKNPFSLNLIFEIENMEFAQNINTSSQFWLA